MYSTQNNTCNVHAHTFAYLLPSHTHIHNESMSMNRDVLRKNISMDKMADGINWIFNLYIIDLVEICHYCRNRRHSCTPFLLFIYEFHSFHIHPFIYLFECQYIKFFVHLHTIRPIFVNENYDILSSQAKKFYEASKFTIQSSNFKTQIKWIFLTKRFPIQLCHISHICKRFSLINIALF